VYERDEPTKVGGAVKVEVSMVFGEVVAAIIMSSAVCAGRETNNLAIKSTEVGEEEEATSLTEAPAATAASCSVLSAVGCNSTMRAVVCSSEIDLAIVVLQFEPAKEDGKEMGFCFYVFSFFFFFVLNYFVMLS
jgi:hypothetical protein